jgi:RNA polymerase sigma factor (sigma-70 family)
MSPTVADASGSLGIAPRAHRIGPSILEPRGVWSAHIGKASPVPEARMPALGPVLENYLRAVGPAVRHLTDGQLLDRFGRTRDGDAFAELVRRHGPLVLGVCRRGLGDSADADDAFQATFLALARRPWSVRRRDTAAPWLYRVSVRITRKAAGRRARPIAAPAPDSVEPRALTDLTAAELWTGLDEELRRLPERLRGPLVLCYLDGRSRDEAARLLGLSVGTLKRRLEAGRKVLRARLVGRGLAPAGIVAAVAGPGLRAAVSPALADRVLAAAASVSMATGRALLATSLALVVGAGVTLVGVYGGPDGKDAPPTPAPPPRVVEAAVDHFGDPLPAGAICRLGTARHRAAGADLAVSPDGKTVVTVGSGLAVRTFDAKTGDTLSTKMIDAPSADRAVLSADGRYIAAGVYPKPRACELRVWDTTTGAEVAQLDLDSDPPSAVAVHGPTKRVAFIRGPHTFPPSDQTACLWDFAKGGKPQALGTFRQPDGTSYGEQRCVFSSDGSRLLCHQTDGRLVCWDVAAAKALWEQSLRHLKYFFFHPDNKHVVIAPGRGVFEVWDAATGEPVAGSRWDGKGTKGALEYWPVAASPDGKLVALLHGDRQIALFDVPRREIVRRLDNPLRTPDEGVIGLWAPPANFAFTPDGTGFVWRAPTVQRWDVATGKPTWPATWDQGHTEAIARLMYTPDGSALVSAARDGAFYVWDPATGRPRHRLPKGWSDLAAVTSDGRTLVGNPRGWNRDNPLIEWDLATGKPGRGYKTDVERPQYGSSADREAAVTADGARVVTLTDNSIANARIPPGRYLTVWDRATGKVIREENVADRVDVTVLAPGGTWYARFAVNAPELGVRIVSVETAKELRRLDDEDIPKGWTPGLDCQLVCSPDGRLLATRLESDARSEKPLTDRPVKVWDPTTGRELGRFPAIGPVRFAFAPDGRSFVIAGRDGLRVFELATRREVSSVSAASIPGQKGGPFADALAVGPGGRTVATGHADGTILIWGATPKRAPLAATDGDAAWTALADADATGWAAVWRLVDAPGVAVRLIEAKLKPAVADRATAELVRKLDAGEFRAREDADRRLRALGSKAESALRTALAGKPSAELKERVEKLLAALEPDRPLTADDLRAARAIQVLELVATADSRRVLAALAAGERGARLTRDAAAALERR